MISVLPDAAAPLIIGTVLGPAAELSLRQGPIITAGSSAAFMVGAPLSGGLLAMTALVLIWLLAAWFRARRLG